MSNGMTVTVTVTTFCLKLINEGAGAIAQRVGHCLACGQPGFDSSIPLGKPGKLPRVSHLHGRAWQATRGVLDMSKTVTTSLTMETLLVPAQANEQWDDSATVLQQ